MSFVSVKWASTSRFWAATALARDEYGPTTTCSQPEALATDDGRPSDATSADTSVARSRVRNDDTMIANLSPPTAAAGGGVTVGGVFATAGGAGATAAGADRPALLSIGAGVSCGVDRERKNQNTRAESTTTAPTAICAWERLKRTRFVETSVSRAVGQSGFDVVARSSSGCVVSSGGFAVRSTWNFCNVASGLRSASQLKVASSDSAWGVGSKARGGAGSGGLVAADAGGAAM